MASSSNFLRIRNNKLNCRRKINQQLIKEMLWELKRQAVGAKERLCEPKIRWNKRQRKQKQSSEEAQRKLMIEETATAEDRGWQQQRFKNWPSVLEDHGLRTAVQMGDGKMEKDFGRTKRRKEAIKKMEGEQMR